ncbi:hypothetical protein [Hymenobacter sp. BT190]|uniref:hypothetical protein n=1 Tax=Hymenobacter sp. BT190 TaxID=2763505 RepID=UPI0016512198|nr:hypothetical protein [Hymenobacter sp. BT190]MBC6697748.1 hypothetical protein [Hymenobacter sp. BT190]
MYRKQHFYTSIDLRLDATEPKLTAGRWLTTRPAARHLEFRTVKLRLTMHGTIEGSLKLAYAG